MKILKTETKNVITISFGNLRASIICFVLTLCFTVRCLFVLQFKSLFQKQAKNKMNISCSLTHSERMALLAFFIHSFWVILVFLIESLTRKMLHLFAIITLHCFVDYEIHLTNKIKKTAEKKCFSLISLELNCISTIFFNPKKRVIISNQQNKRNSQMTNTVKK